MVMGKGEEDEGTAQFVLPPLKLEAQIRILSLLNRICWKLC